MPPKQDPTTALAGGLANNSSPTISPADVMAALGDTDPLVGLALGQMLSRPEPPPDADDEPWPDEPGFGGMRRPSPELLLDRLHELTSELQRLEARLDELVNALLRDPGRRELQPMIPEHEGGS